jgi:hypothetical protein
VTLRRQARCIVPGAFPAPRKFRYNSSASSPANHSIAPLAQLDRASGYEPEGREFESLRAHHLFSAFPDKLLAMKKNVWRAVIEVGFIVFLFYSNLLMGEFEKSGMGRTRGLAWALGDILTAANFGIAMIAGVVGYLLFEFLRKRF